MSVELALCINLLAIILRTGSLVIGAVRISFDKPKKPYWVILGSANGSRNLGDQAMFDAMLLEAEQLLPGCHFVTDSVNPSWRPNSEHVTVIPALSASLRAIPSFYLSSSKFLKWAEKLLHSLLPISFVKLRVRVGKNFPIGTLQTIWRDVIQDSEGVIIAGAGAITSRYAVHGIYSWNLAQYWAKANNRKFVLLGQGLGPFSSRDLPSAMELLKSADFVGARRAVSGLLVRVQCQ
jgi:polysaccharide pyruvyl transferase WcaK-like protein